MASADLKDRVLASLHRQGFRLRGGLILPPNPTDKNQIRRLHEEAVEARVSLARDGLRRHEPRLLSFIASGADVVPERVLPHLVQLRPETEHELLFRYARLHWSIPISAGYGRRLRFLVLDESNGKLIGILGIGDPVTNLHARDQWIGWDRETRRRRLHNVMVAFVLGAVPPYSKLLCGKLVASLVASDEVRAAFARKYGGRVSRIRRKPLDARLALITTTSALGRSSLYNRIRYDGQPVYIRVGFTRGSGEFHFSNGVYGDLLRLAQESCDATAKHSRWGTGFRNKREVIRKCLATLGLSRELVYHGIQREVFVIPLARNTREFLRGEDTRLAWHHRSVAALFSAFRERWLLPRAARDESYREFYREEYRLWE